MTFLKCLFKKSNIAFAHSFQSTTTKTTDVQKGLGDFEFEEFHHVFEILMQQILACNFYSDVNFIIFILHLTFVKQHIFLYVRFKKKFDSNIKVVHFAWQY